VNKTKNIPIKKTRCLTSFLVEKVNMAGSMVNRYRKPMSFEMEKYPLVCSGSHTSKLIEKKNK
jgi:hypothetical protein